MRIALLIVALLVVLAAGGALLVSSLVEAEDLRHEVIRQAEAATGTSIAVEGRIDLAILPQPTLTLANATLIGAGADGQSATLDVDRVDLRMKPLPLLRGQIQVDAVRLVRPVFRVPFEDARALRAHLPPGLRLPLPFAPARVDRLSVVDGRALLVDGWQGPPELSQINVDLVAQDEGGPFEIDGSFAIAEQEFLVSARLGRLTGDATTTLQLELATAGDRAEAAILSFRGVLGSSPRTTEGEAAGSGPGLRLRGQVKLSGDDARAGIESVAATLGRTLPVLPEALASSFRVAGALAYGDGRTEIGELEVAIGPLTADGRLTVAAAEGAPEARLGLAMTRLDLAPLLPVDGRALPLLLGLASWLDGEIDLSAGLVDYQGGVARRLRLTLGLSGQDGITVRQARAVLPGNTDLGFAGQVLALDGVMGVRGDLTAVTDDLRGLLAWLDLRPQGIGADRLRTLSLSGGLELADDLVHLSDVDLQLDGSSVAGSLALDLGERPRFAAALAADRLDLDAYWPQPQGPDPLAALGDLLQGLDTALDVQVARLSWQDLHWDDVSLDTRSVGGVISLKELRARGVTDAALRLRGEIDLGREVFDLAGELSAPRPALLLRRLGYPPPLALARLSPLTAHGSVRGWRDLQLDAGLELEEVEVKMTGDVRTAPGERAGYDLMLEATHPSYWALVQALGLAGPVAGELPAGPLEINGRVRSRAQGGAAVAGSVNLGGTRITGEVGWQETAPRPRLDARLSLGDPRLETLLPLLRLAGARLDALQAQGPVLGNLPEEPLAFDWLNALDARVEVTGKGGLAGQRLELQAGLQDRRLSIERLAATLFGGDAELQLSIEQRAAAPFLALAVELGGIDAADLLALLSLPPTVEGTADLYLEANAAGWSPFALVRNLAGDLAVTVRDGRIVGLDLHGAQPAPAAAGPPATAFETMEGQFDIKRGIATVTAMRLGLDGARAEVDGVIDLLLWVADLVLQVVPAEEAGAPGQVIKLVGPLDRPQIIGTAVPPADAVPAGPLRPTAPASSPAAPADRTPPASAGPGQPPPP